MKAVELTRAVGIVSNEPTRGRSIANLAPPLGFFRIYLCTRTIVRRNGTRKLTHAEFRYERAQRCFEVVVITNIYWCV